MTIDIDAYVASNIGAQDSQWFHGDAKRLTVNCDTYRVSGDNRGKYACIHDAQSLYAVHSKPRVDYAIIGERSHPRCARRMVECLQVVAHVSADLRRLRG